MHADDHRHRHCRRASPARRRPTHRHAHPRRATATATVTPTATPTLPAASVQFVTRRPDRDRRARLRSRRTVGAHLPRHRRELQSGARPARSRSPSPPWAARRVNPTMGVTNAHGSGHHDADQRHPHHHRAGARARRRRQQRHAGSVTAQSTAVAILGAPPAQTRFSLAAGTAQRSPAASPSASRTGSRRSSTTASATPCRRARR